MQRICVHLSLCLSLINTFVSVKKGVVRMVIHTYPLRLWVGQSDPHQLHILNQTRGLVYFVLNTHSLSHKHTHTLLFYGDFP